MTAVADPYAPVNFKDPPARRAPDHPPLDRLRRLRLTREEVDEAERDWREMTTDERFETMAAMEAMNDDELAALLSEQRTEAVEYVSGEEVEATAVNVEDVPDSTVAQVLDWVGDSITRATAALLAEQHRHNPPRKGVVGPLEGLLS